MKKGFGVILWVSVLAFCTFGCNTDSASGDDKLIAVEITTEAPEVKAGEVYVERNLGNNPMVGDSLTGEYVYGGDPSILVDGDTVYLYTGHDVSTDAQVKAAVYNIPEYLCYSSKDLVNWKAEGSVFTVSKANVSWVSNSTSAWAAQVTKHYSKTEGRDLYYIYYCSWDRTSSGKQSIGIAVSESPTGPFVDIGKPLVKGTDTSPETSGWNDIDPTVWIEKDEKGGEHRYLAWGNGKMYICELNEDMISVKDLNGDGKITCGGKGESADIINNQDGIKSFTEAPWIYRRQDEDGNYYGNYYMFYAYGWRESMAYATTNDLLNGDWKFGSVIMSPTATSNTNHMAVFDFKGETYFVYHNGSLPGGSGFRRSACIRKLSFNEDGSVVFMTESANGIYGSTSTIALAGDDTAKLSHVSYVNSNNDSVYPYKDIKAGINKGKETEAHWVIVDGKADRTNDAYVSIQSEDKQGLYLTAGEDGNVRLAQDADASTETAAKQTFRTVKALDGGDGVSFESVSQPGRYITVDDDGLLCLTDGKDAANASFKVTAD